MENSVIKSAPEITNQLKAAPRNHQLGGNSQKMIWSQTPARIKPYGPYLQNRWFKNDGVKTTFFFFSRSKMSENHAQLDYYSVARIY